MRAAFLLIILGIAAAFLPALVGWRDLPVAVPLALLLLGTLRAWFMRRWIGASMFTVGLGAYAWWYFVLSIYAPAPGAPQVGALAPPGVRAPALLVFFRGTW